MVALHGTEYMQRYIFRHAFCDMQHCHILRQLGMEHKCCPITGAVRPDCMYGPMIGLLGKDCVYHCILGRLGTTCTYCCSK